MYTKTVPVKDLNDKPRNITVHFNLFEREVFKLLVELKYVFDWHENMKGELRELDPADVVEFYNNFEEIVLSGYGVPSADAMEFVKTDRYKFEDSVTFNAIMLMCVSDPTETLKLVEGMMPKGMDKLVKAADENLARAAKDMKDEDLAAEIARLRAQLEAKKSDE